MAELSIGEVGKTLQLNLINIDQTQAPPGSTPLDLTGASVYLSWLITASGAQPPAAPSAANKQMLVIPPATAGVVQYSFVSGDLVNPGNMGKYGLFKFSVKVVFAGGQTIYSALDGLLTIKDDSVL